MVIPTNQNRHMYVLNLKSGGQGYKETVSNSDVPGTIGAVKKIGAGNDAEIYFTYKGADTVLRSDRIQLKNLDYVKLIPAWAMLRPLKKIQVTVKDNTLVPNEDYVLRITLRQFHGMSDEDIYIKDAVVRTTDNMSLNTFFNEMVKALNRSFSREVGATANSNPYLEFSCLASGATDLVIREKVQPWTLGIGKQERVYFDVMPTTVFYNGTDFEWGNIADQTKSLYKSDGTTPNVYDASTNTNGIIVPDNAIPNGHEIADLEWFCAGERGDQYRLTGWPDYIPTTYLVDPSLQYNVLEIHHAFTDTGVNSYRGEKDITIVSPNTVAGNVAMNAFIATLETATGLTFADLSPTS